MNVRLLLTPLVDITIAWVITWVVISAQSMAGRSEVDSIGVQGVWAIDSPLRGWT